MLLTLTTLTLALDPAALTARLKAIAADRGDHYKCKIGIGVQSSTLSLAATSDGDVDERFVWGSVTKLLTGSGILRQVEKGNLKLDGPAAPHIDPVLSALGLGSMVELFGEEAAKISAHHLGAMQSGVPDYDTAKPWPRPPTDPFRAQVYASPSTEWDPVNILNVSWVKTGSLDFTPGTKTKYSSTNFVLLGLLLSNLDHKASWDQYNQLSALDALPTSRRAMYSDVKLAVHGSPSNWTTLHGYDRTSYNGHDPTSVPGTDVYHTKGVYGGWTASDVTARISDVARLAYDIFGSSGPRVLQKSSVDVMVPHNAAHGFPYGFATFNLSRSWGVSEGKGKDYNQAYGHLGATYGYQSIVLYFPAADLVIATASNIETDNQVQPSDTACLAYNAVLASINNWTQPTCKFVTSGYYGGVCDCGNDYRCSFFTKKCVSGRGKLSKADCEATC